MACVAGHAFKAGACATSVRRLVDGDSWMAEYGDPDTADWTTIETFSPSQLFDASKDYPATFIWTTTRDDRAHPAHARKMAAKMLAADKDVRYFENTKGGHGAGRPMRRRRTCGR